jgi:hypothetical protein
MEATNTSEPVKPEDAIDGFGIDLHPVPDRFAAGINGVLSDPAARDATGGGLVDALGILFGGEADLARAICAFPDVCLTPPPGASAGLAGFGTDPQGIIAILVSFAASAATHVGVTPLSSATEADGLLLDPGERHRSGQGSEAVPPGTEHESTSVDPGACAALPPAGVYIDDIIIG